ncbi:MAG: sigma-54 interaction domain-containing protein [Acidobacteriota bacterium]
MRVSLIASRFHETGKGVVDLATGKPVTLRRLPSCERSDEHAWTDACERLLHMWHEDLPSLLDYGYTVSGRFEAYERSRPGVLPPRARTAVSAFLGIGEAGPEPAHAEVHLGIRLVPRRALVTLGEVLEDGEPGHPIRLACVADRGAGSTTFLRLAAVLGRRCGYVPVSPAMLDRKPDLVRAFTGRSVLLLCDRNESVHAAERWFFRLGVGATGSHVLLCAADRASREFDGTLVLDPLGPDVLAASVHCHPRIHERRLRSAARESGGLPGQFLQHLRGAAPRTVVVLQVAEAHPAYNADLAPQEPELGHPWADLIADAVRLASRGRTAAAVRDLKQIAAAAERRQIELAAAAAEVELAHILLARGRTPEARELFAARAQRSGGSEQLATRAAIGLGFTHLLQAEFEAAESTFRVSRTVAPVEAAVGLAWTLIIQARDAEAERAIAPARDSSDSAVRAHAAAIGAAIALARQDLPETARAAASAQNAPGARQTDAVASMLQVIIHGRIGDNAGVQQHAERALRAARAARAPLLAIAARATSIEARHALGLPIARGDLERLLRIADRMPLLLRARLWGLLARAHPLDYRRAEASRQLDSFVRTNGARGFAAVFSEPTAAALASDAAVLMGIYESSATPAETLKRLAEWLRDRVNARSVVISDATGAPLAWAGPRDSIAAVNHVLQTRLAQPPWVCANGLESGVIVRYGNCVQGTIACRWPLSRTVTEQVVPVLTASASVAGPAIALLIERRRAVPPAADGIVGKSGAVVRLREQIARAGTAPFPVLVEGESGAGKELVARAIHRESTRRARVCVAINCAAISDDLFEAEVFGHARGAFTGAHVERAGLFEQADGGTLFLDEVSELSARAQAKLLRALQEGEVRRLGENHPRRVDVRVIAASNKRLEEEVAAGRFRSDLLFRLAVIRIAVPPLRDRREDIPLLVSHCWALAAERAATRAVLTPAAVSQLAQYHWPGNVRELQNVMAALAVQLPRGRVGAEHVAAIIGSGTRDGQPSSATDHNLDAARRVFERQFISATIARCGGRHGDAAKQMGITRQGLAKLMKRLEL